MKLSEPSFLAPGPESLWRIYPRALGWAPRLSSWLLCVLQVGLGKKKCLYALEEGVVRYTKEVYVPNPSNSEAVDLVTRLPEGAVLYKTFVHVVPAKPEGTFKLVAMLWPPGWGLWSPGDRRGWYQTSSRVGAMTRPPSKKVCLVLTARDSEVIGGSPLGDLIWGQQ